MDHAGHRDRLRKRYQAEGLGGFAAHEILELLLTYAIPRIDVNPVAHRLINHFGSLENVLEASVEELTHVEGIGEKAASFLSMLLPVFRAYEMEKQRPRMRLKNHGELLRYCRSLFVGVKNEQLYLLCFDAQMQLQATTHNHPSGSVRPSEEDLVLTRNIEVMLGSVGIRLNDHIIVAGEEDFSFFLNGLLNGNENEISYLSWNQDDFSRAADRQGIRTIPHGIKK